MEYVWTAVWPITHILFIDEAIQPEMSLIAEDDFSINIRIIFKLLLSPIHERYASGGQAASVLASIWFCKDIGQDHFVKFATTTSLRCPTLENDVWETHLGFLQLKPQLQQYSRHYGHFFVSLSRAHFVLCLRIQIFPLHAKLLTCWDDYYDHKLDVAPLTRLTANFGSKY